jgi:hypothetical protein
MKRDNYVHRLWYREKREGERLGIYTENLGYILGYAGATVYHSPLGYSTVETQVSLHI